MLYGLDWLNEGTVFPPREENWRLTAYKWYAGLFDINPFEAFGNYGNRLIANFDEYFRLPLLLGYQRLSTIKLADMAVGQSPQITVNNKDDMTDRIRDLRDLTSFDDKLYQALIDYSRYGVTVFRLFNDDLAEEDKGDFAVWDPSEWFPILRKDGTRRIKEHVLVWRVNKGSDINPLYKLNVQRHPIEGGYYFELEYAMDGGGTTVTKQLSSKKVITNYPCLVQYVANLPTTSNIYGTSDYKIVNELIFKATERMRQINYILNIHSDPSMTGPVTMLDTNTEGELEFRTKKFYAVSPGEEHPEYLVWDGKLDAAFKELEMLLNQIYIMSEMGEAFLGNTQGSGQAVSGTAMRYKMVSPLEKARRVTNSFTLPLKKLISVLAKIDGLGDLRYQDINIMWADSLPKDPREVAELTRLQTGAPAITPLLNALMDNYGLDQVAAEKYIDNIEQEQQRFIKTTNDTTPNPAKKGSVSNPGKTGTNSRVDKQ